MKNFIIRMLAKWLNKQGIYLIDASDLDEITESISKSSIEKPIEYTFLEQVILTSAKYNIEMKVWEVIYTIKQNRSKNGEDVETCSKAFKAIDRKLHDAVRVAQNAGNGMMEALVNDDKTLFDIRDDL
jgi:hypothetical protein